MQSKDLHKLGRGESRGGLRETRFMRDRHPGHQWDFFQDPDGQWRWQRLDADGNLVALSPASYRYAIECVHNAEAEGFIVDDEAIRFARILNARARIRK